MSVNDILAQPTLKNAAYPPSKMQYDVLFERPPASNNSEIPSVMSGIENDAKLWHMRAQLQILATRRSRRYRKFNFRWLAEGREEVGLGLGFNFAGMLPANLHYEAVRIRFQAD